MPESTGRPHGPARSTPRPRAMAGSVGRRAETTPDTPFAVKVAEVLDNMVRAGGGGGGGGHPRVAIREAGGGGPTACTAFDITGPCTACSRSLSGKGRLKKPPPELFTTVLFMGQMKIGRESE